MVTDTTKNKPPPFVVANWKSIVPRAAPVDWCVPKSKSRPLGKKAQTGFKDEAGQAHINCSTTIFQPEDGRSLDAVDAVEKRLEDLLNKCEKFSKVYASHEERSVKNAELIQTHVERGDPAIAPLLCGASDVLTSIAGAKSRGSTGTASLSPQLPQSTVVSLRSKMLYNSTNMPEGFDTARGFPSTSQHSMRPSTPPQAPALNLMVPFTQQSPPRKPGALITDVFSEVRQAQGTSPVGLSHRERLWVGTAELNSRFYNSAY